MVANGNTSSLVRMPIYKQSSMSGIYKIINQFSVPVTVVPDLQPVFKAIL